MTSDRRNGLIGNAAIKVPCVAATTAAITLSGNQTIDSIACVTGDRVLVKNQASGVDNGIYIVDTGAWTRAPDFDGTYDVVEGTLVLVTSGAIGGDLVYQQTTASPVIGTSSLAFTIAFSSAAVSSYITTLLDDATAADARTTLGALGTSGGNMTGGINEARGSIAMHATTMDLWAQPNIIDGTSTAVTITAIANAPQAGARRTLYPVAGSIITNGATFAVDGGANVTAQSGDKWEFEAITTSTYKVHTNSGNATRTFDVGTATAAQHALRYDQYKNRIILNDSSTGAGSPGNTSENDLKSAMLTAGGLVVNGDQFHFVMLYRCATNATTKRLKLYFGTTLIGDSTAIAHNSSRIVVEGWIIRTGATSQVGYLRVAETASGVAWSTSITGAVEFFTAAETLANALTLKTTVTLGAGAALNDVIQESMMVDIIKV